MSGSGQTAYPPESKWPPGSKKGQPTYTPDQVNDMLTAWSTWDGMTYHQAGVHLLTFTELGRDPRAVACLFIRAEWDRHAQANVKVASVANWDRLLALHWTESERNLLWLARAFIERKTVLLVDYLSGLGYAHARRVMEAVGICTGYGPGWLAITPGPDLQRHEQETRRLLQGKDPS